MRVSKFPVLEEESGQEESKMEGGREKHRLVTKRGAQAAHWYVGKLGEDVLHVSRGRHGRNVGWVTCDAMKLTWSIIELSLHYGSRRRIFATIGNPSHVVFHTLYSTMRVRTHTHTHTSHTNFYSRHRAMMEKQYRVIYGRWPVLITRLIEIIR